MAPFIYFHHIIRKSGDFKIGAIYFSDGTILEIEVNVVCKTKEHFPTTANALNV